MDRSRGLEGVYLCSRFSKFICLCFNILQIRWGCERSDELFVFAMSSVSRKRHTLQPFEDALSVTSRCSIFHEPRCVGTLYKVLQQSRKAPKPAGSRVLSSP